MPVCSLLKSRVRLPTSSGILGLPLLESCDSLVVNGRHSELHLSLFPLHYSQGLSSVIQIRDPMIKCWISPSILINEVSVICTAGDYVSQLKICARTGSHTCKC